MSSIDESRRTFGFAVGRALGWVAIVVATSGQRCNEESGQVAPDAPDFSLEVSQSMVGRIGVPLRLTVVVVPRNSFSDSVLLEFQPLGTDVSGSFDINFVRTQATLLLDVPASNALQTRLQLGIKGTSPGLSHEVAITIDLIALFSLAVQPSPAALRLANFADINVRISRIAAGVGGVDLSVEAGLPGVRAEFLNGAPRWADPPPAAVMSTLRLTCEAPNVVPGTLLVRATALTVVDRRGNKAYGTSPLVVSAVLSGDAWEFVGNGLAYATTNAETVGLGFVAGSSQAMQVSWLEGQGSNRKLYLRQFDGATFAPVPSAGAPAGLAAPTGAISEAAYQAASGKALITYQDPAGLALATVDSLRWTISEQLAIGGPRARAPRIATSASGVSVLSYVVEDLASASSRLFARSSASGPSAAVAGTGPGGSLNRDPDGRVLADSCALAMDTGQAAVAWIEQPADPAAAPTLWLRFSNSIVTGWRDAVAVRIDRGLSGSQVRLVFGSTGVFVAWRESSPARLMVAAVTNIAGAAPVVTLLRDEGNADGALNVTASGPARDVGLTLQTSSDTPVIAWTEGTLKPVLVAKRYAYDFASGTRSWVRLGDEIDGGDVAVRSPRIAVAGDGVCYVAYSRYLSGDISTPEPMSDVFVARGLFS